MQFNQRQIKSQIKSSIASMMAGNKELAPTNSIEKESYLITQTLPQLVRMMDRGIGSRAKEESQKDIRERKFVAKRLSSYANLSKLQ